MLARYEAIVGERYARLELYNDFFFQAEDGIRDLVRSRGLGDVYKRQPYDRVREGGNELIERDPREEAKDRCDDEDDEQGDEHPCPDGKKVIPSFEISSSHHVIS